MAAAEIAYNSIAYLTANNQQKYEYKYVKELN